MPPLLEQQVTHPLAQCVQLALQHLGEDAGRYSSACSFSTAEYNTCYCNNIAPGETERTCRKVGAHRKAAKDKAGRTPAQREYEWAYNRLKTRKHRGKIDVDEWNAAVAQAQELRDRSEWGELTDEELREKLNQL